MPDAIEKPGVIVTVNPIICLVALDPLSAFAPVGFIGQVYDVTGLVHRHQPSVLALE